MPPRPPSRILVVQTAFLGDVVFTTALLRGLRDLFGDAELNLLASPRGGGILRGDNCADEVIIYDKRGTDRGARAFLRLLRDLRGRRFDLVVSPHLSFRTAMISLLCGAPRRLGFRSGPGGFAYNIGCRLPVEERRPYRRELALLEGLSPGSSSRYRPKISVSPEAGSAVGKLLAAEGARGGRPRIALAVGTVWPTKKWPLEHYHRLGKRLIAAGAADVLVVGGPAESDEARIFTRSEGFVNLVGRTPMESLPALLSACDALVAADTGPLHVAMAVGVPVVALFGPTDERQFEFGPGDRCLTRDLTCRPCSPHGGRRCPEGNWRCMPEIAVEEVEAALDAVLSGRPGDARPPRR